MIPEKQDVLNALVRKYLSDPEPTASQPHGHRAPALSDEEVLDRLRRARNSAKFSALFDRGDTADYDGDDSRADLALVGLMAYYSDDPDQLDRLFRRSALMRRKWDARRGSSTYGRRTIEEARHNRTERYAAPPPSGSFSFSLPYKDINDKRSSRPVVQRFSEMGPPEPRRYLIDGLLPAGYPTVLYGDGGVAKSMLALSMSLAVSRGVKSWLGHAIEESGPVLYIDLELDAQEQNRRVNRLARAEGLSQPPHDLLYLSGLGFAPGETLAAAYEAAEESRVVLVVLDSLGLALQGDAEAARDVIRFYRDVLEPFRAVGASVLGIDHQSKLQPGERYQNKRAFGSVFKGNLARSVIQVQAGERTENQLPLRLRQVKHNFGPLADPLGVELTFTEELVTVEHRELGASAMAEEHTLSAAERVRYALEEGPAYPDEIAEATGLAPATVKSTLTKLRKTGEVEPTGERGKWGAEQIRLSFLPSKGNENDPGGEVCKEVF